ncbi:carbamoyltransferase HypF [Thermopolyspora sp. NPDC052614]|uniref:carbamoyltransferase HypF n=1 Tax=Thermopolyspora sp. NPDC052614 TaxID=3155682 RepID=UPI00344A9FAA
MSDARIRCRIRVEGIVQGVGFRPFVYALARGLGLAGLVGNDSAGVFIEVEGPAPAISRFERAVRSEAPPMAVISRVVVEPIPPVGEQGFAIISSRGGEERQAWIAPDVATCADCLREVFDPVDRRYRYAFANCANCGPRFTVAKDVPYDREATTMAGFPMCAECSAEYNDPADRRFHAQPICCPACGPKLRLVNASGDEVQGDPIVAAARMIRAGRVVAIKGLGGYHLAADAKDENAAITLRARKVREDKPFAVMVPDLATAERLCEVDETARRLLSGPRRPIVVLPRRTDAPVAAAVAPDNRFLGLMLPYTPLHHLLAAELAGPYILTSGNTSDEPIALDDEDAFRRLNEIADAFLTHDRPIHMRAEDSVILLHQGQTTPVRRSRGYAPQPLPLRVAPPRPVLGCGAESRNTFCLAKDGHAFVSQHIGDLKDFETLKAFRTGIAHLGRLFDIEPRVVAHDLNPEFLSTKYARELTGVELVGVQHHHAHIASCLADNEESGTVIGVAFDGLGYGPDGTIWGGELLVADLLGYMRAGHLLPVRVPGGSLAIREPWRMAAAYLDAAPGAPKTTQVRERHASRWDFVVQAARSGANSPLTSSAGRLFDAVSAILGVRESINYDGQAAIELEQHADPAVTDAYPVRVLGGHPLLLDGPDLVRSIADDMAVGTPTPVIAARFHNSLAVMVAEACDRIRTSTSLGTVALSGGVFQNRLLLGRVVPALRERGFRVLTHRHVPPNDGGISLGQVAITAARDAGRYGRA